MRLVRLRAPGGLENLKLVEEDHPKPRPGELLVRIRASSLNFHDDLVVPGKIPYADGRIPMSDGAGEVIAVGDDVDEFKVADTVVSTFWPYWLGGEMTPATYGGQITALWQHRGINPAIKGAAGNGEPWDP
jgi:NADPH:quinone reductase-like Zn-dependent oxidoreductase